jgi:hypothetical protein
MHSFPKSALLTARCALLRRWFARHGFEATGVVM